MRALAIALAVFALPAGAQEELGLDLSDEEVPEEFRPALAVIGVSAVAGSDDVQVSRARLLEVELVRQANGNTKFGRVLLPAQVVDALGAEAPAARTCVDFACLNALADKLAVQRVIVATVAKGGTTSLLTVYGIDPTQSAVVSATAESGEKAEKQQIGGFTGLTGKSQTQKDKEFLKKSTPAFADVIGKLGTPLAKLVVDCFENTAETRLNGKLIGKGSFSIVLPHGEYKLATTGQGFLPFEKDVKLDSMKVESVRVTLVAKPLDRPAVVMTEAPKTVPALQRPGLYLAAGGIVALGVAVALGASTLGVTDKDSNGDGVVDATRAQVVSARGAAITADILYGVGAAAVVGGAIWFFVTPSVKKASSQPQTPRGPDEPDQGAGAGLGLILGAGGTF